MRAPITKDVLAGALLVVAASAAACGAADAKRLSQTTTTGVSIPRPEATGVTTRTIDNAGFVDNGGRTSDETNRSQMSGMRATEVGSERPTGTPGSGMPVPIPPSAPPRSVSEAFEGGHNPTAAPKLASIPSQRGGLGTESAARLARARCDRETACNRVGAGRPWRSQESCVTSQHERVNADFASLDCEHGTDSTQLGLCLNAVRQRACGDVGPELENVSACRSSALCAE